MEDYKKLYEQTQSKMKEFIKRWDGIKLSSNDLFTEELKQIVEIESEEEQNKFAKGVLTSCALSFINYLDAHKYEGKMCVSNGECEDIENAFHNAMWDRLHRYYCKYIEKQGEPNPYSGVSFKYNGHTWGMCARDNGVEILVDGEIEERIFLDNKPQGKSALEAIKEEKVDNELAKSLCSEYTQKLYNPSDTGKNEQKPADKIEPKFKVGDWVVNKFGNSYHIDSLDKKNYQVSDGKGNYNYFPISKQDKMHLWTIKDGRDGDVLSFYSEYKGNKMVQIGIIEKYVGKYGGCSNTFKVYVGVNWDNNLQMGKYMGCSINIGCSDIHPATKEQRDALMKAMNDAGYEWDAEKKELFHNQNQNG